MDESSSAVSRADFLRASAAGVAGVTALALSSGPSLLAAQPGGRRGYVVTVTHGLNDPTRVMLALLTATRLPAGDNHVWFAIDGGQICRKDTAQKVTSPLFVKQGNAAKLLAQIQDNGTALHI